MADLSKIEQKLYQFLLQRGTPANQEQIQAKIKLDEQELAQVLNGLIQKTRIEIYNQGSSVLFSAVPEESLAEHKMYVVT